MLFLPLEFGGTFFAFSSQDVLAHLPLNSRLCANGSEERQKLDGAKTKRIKHRPGARKEAGMERCPSHRGAAAFDDAFTGDQIHGREDDPMSGNKK
jgi:hypothetical protein